MPEAIKAALGVSCADFAREHGFYPPHVSTCIRGKQRHEKIRSALAATLEVDPEWLAAQLDAFAEERAAA